MDRTNAQICQAMKILAQKLKKDCRELDDLFCEIRAAEGRAAYPEVVREAAFSAIAGVNRFDFCLGTDLDVVHVELGLGVFNMSGPCEHEENES